MAATNVTNSNVTNMNTTGTNMTNPNMTNPLANNPLLAALASVNVTEQSVILGGKFEVYEQNLMGNYCRTIFFKNMRHVFVH